MFLEVALENLEFRVSLFVTLGTLVDLVKADNLLEGFHDETTLHVVLGEGREGVHTCTLQVSQSLRLGWHRWHEVPLGDARED